MYIDLFRSELVAGYQQARNARQALLEKWRPRLLQAYTKRWDGYARALERNRADMLRAKSYLPWLGGGLSILLLGGFYLLASDYYEFGLALIFGALLGGVSALTILAILAWKPAEPEHPLEQSSKKTYVAPLKQRLFPNLLPAWQQAIELPVPWQYQVESMAQAQKKWGLIGEFNLIRELERIAPPNTLLLHSLMPKLRDDMDVVAIGPKGFWYFEVKYINAEFEWADGVWKVWKLNPRTGEIKPEEMNETPDAQWYRMRAEALKVLNSNGHDLLKRLSPRAGQVQGGIVLAHPKATFNIQKSPPFRWGTVRGWVNEFDRAPLLPEMTPPVIFRMAEILLTRHQELNRAHRVISMNAHAASLVQTTEQKIREWVNP